jgi:predicted RND superfamily exporter protein
MSAHPPGFYGRLARWVLGHRVATLALLAIVTLLAATFAVRLRVDSDILTLMPEDEPSTQALKRLDEQEGGINFLTIAVDAQDTTKRDAYLADLSGRLEAMPEVDYVLYELDPAVAFRLGLLQVPQNDLLLIRDRLRSAVALGPAALSPFISARLLGDLGPLTTKLQSASQPIQLNSGDRMGRMVVRPTGSAHDLPFARVFMAKVDAAIVASDPAGHGVTIPWIGGAYRHNVEDYEGIVRDIGWITAASFVMVLVIIAAAFRSPRSLAIIFVPLVISNLWTLGLAGATVGSLNTFTSFVNAVLIGLGVEFGVHLYARYRELRVAGHPVEESVVRAWDLVGSACTSAAFTSAAGFAALLAAHFDGFRQLGWLLSFGLVFCLIAELVCMPLLLVWLDREHITPPHHTRHRHHKNRRRRPASYAMAPMVLIVLGFFTIAAAVFIPRIQFEFDLSELRRSGLAYEDLSDSEKALARDSYSPLVVSFPDAAALDTAYEAITARIADGRFPEVATALSIRSVIPADQEAKLVLLREIVALGKDPNAAYLPPQVRENLARLADVPLDKLAPADLPAALQHVLGASHGQHRLLLLPSGNMWDMREAAALAKAVERELPGVEVAGEYLTLGVLYDLMFRDAPVIGAIALGLVILFTLLDLRSVRATAGAIAVLLAGVIWWGSLLVAAGIKISIVNFVGIPIVLGIGIDVMIHLIHRMKQEGPGRIQKVLATTGWAAALGTFTTVVAFAALSLASSQGIRSLGLLVLLGETAVTIAGFVLVPLGFATAWRLQGRQPPPSEDTNPG